MSEVPITPHSRSGTITLGTTEAGPVNINLETLIATRMLVTASSGGGKSETLRRILEEASQHVQCIVIDPEGEFSTLREKYPFVLVGEGGETPADIRSADLVARKLLELGVSAVCDLYEMRPIHNRHEWVRRFINAMVEAPKELWHPVIIILDEAHTFAPEKGYSESVALASVMDLASLGRKRGYCLIAATQRLSKLNKNVVEPLQNYVIGRTTFNDQKRAADVFKIDPGAATREFSLELERLKPGQFIVRGQAFNMDMPRMMVTRGVTRPPKTGTALAGRVTPAPEAIRALLPKLADLPHEAEKQQQDQDNLRRELQQARSEVERLTEQLERLKTAAGHIEAENEQHRERLNAAREVAAKLLAMLSPISTIEDVREEMSTTWPEDVAAALTAIDDPSKYHDVFTREPAAVAELPPGVREEYRRLHMPAKPNGKAENTLIRRGARRMLASLATWYPQGRTEGQVAAEAKLKRNSGTWSAYKSELKMAGLIETGGGHMQATKAGVAFFGGALPKSPTSTNEVLDLWRPKLRRGSRRMLAELVKLRGNTISRSVLAELANISEGSGTFSAYLSELRTAGLIVTEKNGVRANRETLFL